MTKANKNSQLIIRLGTLALAAMLAACGGGDDTPTTPTTSTPSTSTTVVTAPTTSPSTGVEQSGNLSYLVTAADHSTRTVPATVAYSAPKGTLTLDPGVDELVITTADEWENITWPTGYSGTLAANGNAGLVCDGQSGENAQIGLSHNMKLVANPLDIVKGKTFTFYECDPGLLSYTVVFNADGSATPDGETVSAAVVTAIFSADGQTDADGSNFKLRLYAYTQGSNTGYVLVETGSDKQQNGSFYKFIGLGRQQ